MRSLRFLYALVLLSLLIASCAPPKPDMAALKKTVEEFDAAGIDAMTTGNADKIMSYYVENAISMPPNSQMLKGREAIKGWMDQMMKSGMKLSDVKFATTDMDAAGKIAFTVGTYEMTVTKPEPMGTMKDNGKYVSIWKQQQDGSWKVYAEIWNTNLPMPSMDQMMEKKEPAKKEMRGK